MAVSWRNFLFRNYSVTIITAEYSAWKVFDIIRIQEQRQSGYFEMCKNVQATSCKLHII